MAATDRISIVRTDQASHYPEPRSNPQAGRYDILPLPAEPYGWGLPFPTGTATETTVSNITPARFADLEAVTIDIDGTTKVLTVDPDYDFESIADDYARGMAKLKSALAKDVYFAIVNISANSVTPANYDLAFILPATYTVDSIDAGGTTTNAD